MGSYRIYVSLFLIFPLLLHHDSLSFVVATANDDINNDCNENNVDSGTCQQNYQSLGKPTEYIDSSTIDVKLALRRWEPEADNNNNDSTTKSKSVAIFLHGGAGFHSGYSDILGRSMKNVGIPLILYDSVGQGYSDSIKGIRTYYDSIETLTNDFTTVLNYTRSQYKDYKVFVIGESFGGFVLLSHILQEQQKTKDSNIPSNFADGYILASPMVKVLRKLYSLGKCLFDRDFAQCIFDSLYLF
jgi:alpha-beta hydrolase superfamily lysophospholipase